MFLQKMRLCINLRNTFLLSLILCFSVPIKTQMLGGSHVKTHQVPVATASSVDPYTCFVDAPNAHATTGCRKNENICFSKQAVATSQYWNNTEYVWEWECSFLTYQQCGLQWCSQDAFCSQPNLCLCNSGLNGSPLTGCFNTSAYYSNNTNKDKEIIYRNRTIYRNVNVPVYIPSDCGNDTNYFPHFMTFLFCFILALAKAIFWMYLYYRKEREDGRVKNNRVSPEIKDMRERYNSAINNPVYVSEQRNSFSSGSFDFKEDQEDNYVDTYGDSP